MSFPRQNHFPPKTLPSKLPPLEVFIQCFYLLLKIKNLFKARENAAKCSFSSVGFQNFLDGGFPPLDAFGVSMSLPAGERTPPLAQPWIRDCFTVARLRPQNDRFIWVARSS